MFRYIMHVTLYLHAYTQSHPQPNAMCSRTRAQAIWQFWQMSKGLLWAMACRKSPRKLKIDKYLQKEYGACRAQPFHWPQHYQMLSSVKQVRVE